MPEDKHSPILDWIATIVITVYNLQEATFKGQTKLFWASDVLPNIRPWNCHYISYTKDPNIIRTYVSYISIMNYVHSRTTVPSDIQAIYSMFFKYVSFTENKIHEKDSSDQKLGVHTWRYKITIIP
jgi:hypothetical protein